MSEVDMTAEQQTTADRGSGGGEDMGSALPWPSLFRARYVLAILALAYTVSWVDRMVLSLLVGPIKADLGLSDTMIGLLQGFAFAVFYTLVGLPVARLADYMNRKKIITTGVALWSFLTAACGLANSAGVLFVTRIGVGVGEAFLGPSAYSIMSDYFSPKRLTRAISIYSMGLYGGSGLAMLLGGVVYAWASGIELPSLPLIGLPKPWQVTFFVAAVPGLIVAALMFTVREPVRRGLLNPADGQRTKAVSLPIPFVIRFIAKHWKIYVTIILSHSFLGIVIVGGLSWIPEFFIRTYGMARMDLGYYLGVIMVVFGPLGLLAGSQTTNWLRNRGYKDANLRAAAIGTVIMVLPASLMTLMPNQELALVLMAGMVFFTAFPVAAEIAALQMVTPNQMRAQVSAIFMLTVNIIGPGFGPVIIGASTDFIFGNEADLRYSMAIVAFCAATISAILILLGVKHFNEGLDEAASWNRT